MKSHTIETQFFRYIVPIFAALFLAGCSGAPSESVGKQDVESYIQREKLNDLFKLLSFRKTNGIRDGNFYRMEYEVEVEFLEDCHFAPSSSFWHAERDEPAVPWAWQARPPPGNTVAVGCGDAGEPKKEIVRIPLPPRPSGPPKRSTRARHDEE